VEREDDKGHFQQVSGGFGDSNNVDEETIQKIMEQQQLMYAAPFINNIII
jgi:hypothetical protein